MNEIKILLERLEQIQKAAGEAMQILQRISSTGKHAPQESVAYDPDQYLHHWTCENTENTSREKRCEEYE